MRVYRDRRDEKEGSGQGVRPSSQRPDRSSAGMKVLDLDDAPTLTIESDKEYDNIDIERAEVVTPEKYSTIEDRELLAAREVGPDGRTAYRDWEKKLKEEERAAAAQGLLMEVGGSVVQRRFHDFRPRCPDCRTTGSCQMCGGKGKRYYFFRCKFCAGSGRCLQCLPVAERPCPQCGKDMPLSATSCTGCGKEFQCPVCRRHLPFESTSCPTCERQFTCVFCGEPVAMTYQKNCPVCGGEQKFKKRRRKG